MTINQNIVKVMGSCVVTGLQVHKYGCISFKRCYNINIHSMYVISSPIAKCIFESERYFKSIKVKSLTLDMFLFKSS